MYPPETIEVLDRHQFDVEALGCYLRGRITGLEPPFVVREFRGGQSNPTYYLSGADPLASPKPQSREGGSGPREFVLRRKPPGQLLPSAHAIEREYQVMTALRASGVPVPRTYMLCDDPSVIGTSFFVMEYIAGHPMIDATLADRSPDERRAIYRSMIKTGQLHRAAGTSLDGAVPRVGNGAD